jgi:metal-responsive CopG/Arc/MetJ family transcriptional regulator
MIKHHNQEEIKMSQYNIMAVVVNHRTSHSVEVQQVLTKYGCSIKVRLGLHEAGQSCSDEGLMLLQLCGEQKEIEELHTALSGIKGVRVQKMTL